MSQKKRVRIYKAGGQQGQYINPTAKWMMQMGGQGQGQDEQIMIAVQQAILQGAEPNDVYDNLVAQGLPGNKVGQIVQLVLDNIDNLEEEAYVEESGDQDAAIELAQREAEEMQAQSQNQFNDMMQGAPSVNDMIMEDDDDYDDSEFEDDLYDLQKGGIPKRDDFIKQVKKQYGGKVKQGQKPEDVSSEQVFNFLDKVKQSNEQALLDKQLEQQAAEYYDNVMLPEAQRGREVRRANRQQRQLNRGVNKIMRNTPVGFMGPGMLPQNIGVINPFGMPQTIPQGNMQGFPGLQMANIEVHKTGLFGRPKQYSMTFNYNNPNPIKEAVDVATSTAQSITDNEARKQQEGTPSNKEAAQELEKEIDAVVSEDNKQKTGSDKKKSDKTKEEINLENTESSQESAYVRNNPLLDPKYWRDNNRSPVINDDYVRTQNDNRYTVPYDIYKKFPSNFSDDIVIEFENGSKMKVEQLKNVEASSLNNWKDGSVDMLDTEWIQTALTAGLPLRGGTGALGQFSLKGVAGARQLPAATRALGTGTRQLSGTTAKGYLNPGQKMLNAPAGTQLSLPFQQGGFVNPFQSNPLAEFLYGGNLPKAQGGLSGQGCVVNPNTGATNCFPSNNSQTGNVKPLNQIDNENQPPQWFKDWQKSQQAQQSQRQYYPQQYPGYGGGMQYPYGTGYGNIPTMFNPYGRRPVIQRNPNAWMQQRGLATDAQGNPVTNPQALPLTRFAVTKSGLFGKPRRWEAEFGNYNQNAAQSQRPEKVVTQQDLDASSAISTEGQDNYQPSSFGEKLMLSNNRLLSRIGSKMTPIGDNTPSPKESNVGDVDSLPLRTYGTDDLYTNKDLKIPFTGNVDQLPVRPYEGNPNFEYTPESLSSDNMPSASVTEIFNFLNPGANVQENSFENLRTMTPNTQRYYQPGGQASLYSSNPFEEEDQAILNAGRRNDYGQVIIPDYNQQPSMQTEQGFSDYYSPEESINRAADMIGTGQGTAEIMPQETPGYKTKGKFKNQFDVDFGAAWDMANYGARTVLGNLSEEEKKRQHYARMMGMQTGVDSVNRFRGNYATNQVAAAPNFRDPQAGQMMYSQQGGQFNIGDEVEMTDDEIAKFVAGGGKLRYV